MNRVFRTGWGWLAAALLALFAIPVAQAAEPRQVLLLLSEQHAAYQHFRQSYEKNLPPNVRLEIRTLGAQQDMPKADLLVTAGSKAAQWAADNWRGAMLAAMLPSDNFKQLQSGKVMPRPMSGLFLDQPLIRQVALVRSALPAATRVGILYTQGGEAVAEPLRKVLAKQGATLSVRAVQPGNNLAAALDDLLPKIDVLLAVPDSDIYNSSTIRNILLGSYRRGVPMVGLSAAYVSAGALCAVYSTPEQQAAQSANMSVEYLQRGVMPGPRHPQLYQIALNAEVARSLRLNLRSVEALRIEIDHVEGGGE